MTYKEHIGAAMEMLGREERTVVVGYNVSRIGGFGGGTFSAFPEDRIEEMPLAEASMMGSAIGLSLGGFIPIVWFERMDFTLLASDQIVNTLAKLAQLSEGQHKPACIIRCAVGNKEAPLFTGPTHTQNFARAFRELVDFPVIELRWPQSIVSEYEWALERAEKGVSTIIIEFRDDYSKTE